MVLKGGARFEEKNLSAVRPVYPCIHSGDFHRFGFAGMASCCYRGCPYYNPGLHDAADVGGDYEDCCNETSENSDRNYKGYI